MPLAVLCLIPCNAGDLLPLVLQHVGPALNYLLSGGEQDPDMTPDLQDLLGGYYAQLMGICTWAGGWACLLKKVNKAY